MVVNLYFPPAMIAAALAVLAFVAIKTLIELIP